MSSRPLARLALYLSRYRVFKGQTVMTLRLYLKKCKVSQGTARMQVTGHYREPRKHKE